MPRDLPNDEGKQEPGSRWQGHNDNDHPIDSDSNSIYGIFGKRKKNKKTRPKEGRETDSHNTTIDRTTTIQDSQVTEKIFDATNALEEMRSLGLEPKALKQFTISLHKLAVASGVAPNLLASIIKEVSDLCEGKKISLVQARKTIEELTARKNVLIQQVETLEKKKQSLEVDLRLKELEHSTNTQILTEYMQIKNQLEKHQISFKDISKLITLINNTTEQRVYDSSIIVEALENLKSRQDQLREIETEIGRLTDTKRTLQGSILTLEQEISSRQETLNSAEELRKMGFDFKELDRLQSAIKMISQTRNIDVASARNQLLSDLESYYANDHELRKRIRILESLLEAKEEKFKMLEADYQNEKAVLDNAKKLISEGFDRKWIEKLQIVIDTYGMDLDLLSEELKQHQALKARINELQQNKRTLEEEEHLIRQKVIAMEDQQIRTLSLIKDMMSKSSQPSASIKMQQGKGDFELGELIRAAQDDNNMSEAEFKISARKAIDIICSRLRKNSPARVVLEHAQLAMRYEDERNRQ